MKSQGFKILKLNNTAKKDLRAYHMLNKYLTLLCYHFTRYKVTAQDHSAHEVLSVLAPAPGNGPHGFILKRCLVEEGGTAPI